MLANFIARVGMFSKAFSWEFKLAWKAYVAGPTQLDPYLAQLNTNVSTDREKYDANPKPGKLPFVPRVYRPKIKVVGCWDTVASLGLPWHPISNPGGVSGEYQYFDGSLAPGTSSCHDRVPRIEPLVNRYRARVPRLGFRRVSWTLYPDVVVSS